MPVWRTLREAGTLGLLIATIYCVAVIGYGYGL